MTGSDNEQFPIYVDLNDKVLMGPSRKSKVARLNAIVQNCRDKGYRTSDPDITEKLKEEISIFILDRFTSKTYVGYIMKLMLIEERTGTPALYLPTIKPAPAF